MIEIIKYPILTDKKYISNKSIDYRMYVAFLIDSSFYDDFRYIYQQKFFENKEELIKKMDIKRNTFNVNLKNFLKFDLVTNEKFINEDFEIKKIFKFKNIKDQKYVILNDQELEKLIECKNSNEIKVYLILKYLLREKKIRTIELRFLAKTIGLSKTNTTKTIKKYIKNLVDLGLIKITIFFEFDFENNKRIKRYKFKLIK